VALADRQNGVVGYDQLIALGYGPSAIQRLVVSGWLQRIFKGVYAVGRSKLTRQGHWMAAVLACGPDSLLSHFNAAALWGIWDTNQRKIDVTVMAKRASRARIRVHETSILHAEDTTVHHGIPVTSVARTFLELAAHLNATRLRKAVDEAARQRILDLRAIDRAIGRSPKRRGAAKFQEIISDHRPPPDARSRLEIEFWEAIRDDPAIPTPQVNVLVAGIEVDFFWPATRLVVELDSRRYHMGPHEFENDRIRDAKLLRAHCRTLRVTDARMHHDRAQLLDDVRALSTPPRASPREARQPRERRRGTA
jgi:very-short-patch-repair endonuclease